MDRYSLNQAMYFKRFSQKDLDMAIANESITTEHVARILKFYHENTFVLKDLETIQKLQTIIPDITPIDQDIYENLYFYQVHSWPHIKPMCLKFSKQNPCLWIYVTQDEDQLLFTYDLDSYNITFSS